MLRRACLVGAIVWAAVIPLAAMAAVRPDSGSAVYAFAIGAYALGRVICHQLPVRSFHLWGAALPVCARCTGIYVGAAITALAVSARPAASAMPSAAYARRVVIVSLIPTAITLAYEWTTGVMPANGIRAIAGFPIGAAVVWLIGTLNPEP
jgi:uncharacterized membrane protein